MTIEHERLNNDGRAWKQWGPYLSERAWGTVREDYSATGEAWDYSPHDQARSRAYRWNEDGLAGICDDRQELCFALAFWNGRDPILKERIFGLTGPQGNHGEDAKEYWWYLDSTPTHSWMRWRYMYAQAEFPYTWLVEENRSRGKYEREFELADTGIFDDGWYWDITADYAKASPDDVLIRISVRNNGPETATIDVLPTLWYRNTWSWGLEGSKPELRLENGSIVGTSTLSGEGSPEALFCENETNTERLFGVPGSTPYPKDGINDHVVQGAATVNPDQTGTKAAFRYRLEVGAGETAVIRLRLRDEAGVGSDFDDVSAAREAEADEFYAELTPAGASDDEALVLRQALAGMLWAKQFYHLDVQRWLDGDPAGPQPPESRKNGRNHEWTHLNNADVISMPDKWEYPWYAAWDLAFHCVSLAHVDPEFAKSQLILLCREWYMHPNGQLPAYEWAFGDVNPPVHAWAALRVYEIAGDEDFDFLERIFHKLLLNFTWWVNRKDAEGNNLFEGGFLGLDNIGPFDRSALGVAVPLRARSMVGLLPLAAVTTLGPATMARLPEFMRRIEWFTANRPEGRAVVQHLESEDHAGWRMLAIVDEDRLRRVLSPMLDPSEFLSDHGLRALSRYHADHPLQISVDGVMATLDYEPGESTSGLFGGNSNWRGPIWFPVNYLLVEVLRVYHRYLGDAFQVEFPTGSGRALNLAQIADELAGRLTSIFLRGEDGRRPVFGGYRLLQEDPSFRDLIPFHEYFHADTGQGLGASHQTGWTGLVADLIIRRGR